jgi:Tfp pilus assembly protein PilF
MKILAATVKRKNSICILALLALFSIGCKTPVVQKEKLLEPVSVSAEDAVKYFAEGVNYNKEKKYFQAIDSFSRAIKIDPAFQRAYLGRGVTYHHVDRHSEAVEDFSQAIMLGNMNRTDNALA